MTKKLAEFIRSLDLTSIILGIFTPLLGGWSWVLALIGRPFLKGVENQVDKDLGQYVASVDSDTSIDATAAQNVDQNQKAKTDEQVDDAFRNSLPK